jgi:hypothetical protein
VIGVGIGADFVNEIYPDAIVVDTFRQLAEELLQVLVQEVRIGPRLSSVIPSRPGTTAWQGVSGA